MNPLRSILAIFGGLVLLRLLDQVLMVAHPFSAALVGYVIAKLARQQEVRHAAAAGAIQTGIYAWGFLTLDAALLPPTWMRIVLLVTTVPALLLGAHIRAQAREIQASAPAPEPREPTR